MRIYLSQFDNNITCMLSNGHEKRIMDLIVKDYSWEQVIYEIIAAEGMDPWNLNLNSLSSSFMNYIEKIKDLDFRIPAKYIIIASVILRMKSDFLQFLDFGKQEEIESFETEEIQNHTVGDALEIAINVPAKRVPRRRVVVTDLIDSLKKVLSASERKEFRLKGRTEKLKIDYQTSVIERINNLYSKIVSLLNNVKKDEVEFSKVVPKWERKAIIEHFMPLMHLDNQRKLDTRQENMFDEIFIKKLN